MCDIYYNIRRARRRRRKRITSSSIRILNSICEESFVNLVFFVNIAFLVNITFIIQYLRFNYIKGFLIKLNSNRDNILLLRKSSFYKISINLIENYKRYYRR